MSTAKGAPRRLCGPALEADPLLVDLLFDVRDGFARIQSFRACLGAVHDGHTAVQLHMSQRGAVYRRARVLFVVMSCMCG